MAFQDLKQLETPLNTGSYRITSKAGTSGTKLDGRAKKGLSGGKTVITAVCMGARASSPATIAGLQGKNLIFPQFPRLPLYKERLQILTKLRKVESKTKESFIF